MRADARSIERLVNEDYAYLERFEGGRMPMSDKLRAEAEAVDTQPRAGPLRRARADGARRPSRDHRRFARRFLGAGAELLGPVDRTRFHHQRGARRLAGRARGRAAPATGWSRSARCRSRRRSRRSGPTSACRSPTSAPVSPRECSPPAVAIGSAPSDGGAGRRGARARAAQPLCGDQLRRPPGLLERESSSAGSLA